MWPLRHHLIIIFVKIRSQDLSLLNLFGHHELEYRGSFKIIKFSTYEFIVELIYKRKSIFYLTKTLAYRKLLLACVLLNSFECRDKVTLKRRREETRVSALRVCEVNEMMPRLLIALRFLIEITYFIKQTCAFSVEHCKSQT